jgi:hypothetical protein
MKYILGQNKEDYIDSIGTDIEFMKKERDELITLNNELKMVADKYQETLNTAIEKEYKGLKINIKEKLFYNTISVSTKNDLTFYIQNGKIESVDVGYSYVRNINSLNQIEQFYADSMLLKEFIYETDMTEFISYFRDIKDKLDKTNKHIGSINFIINWITTYLKQVAKPIRKESKESIQKMKDFFKTDVIYYMALNREESRYRYYTAFKVSETNFGKQFIFGTIYNRNGSTNFEEPYRTSKNRLLFNNKNVEKIYNHINRPVVIKGQYDRDYNKGSYIYFRVSQNYKTDINEKFEMVEMSPDDYKRYEITGEL